MASGSGGGSGSVGMASTQGIACDRNGSIAAVISATEIAPPDADRTVASAGGEG